MNENPNSHASAGLRMTVKNFCRKSIAKSWCKGNSVFSRHAPIFQKIWFVVSRRFVRAAKSC